VSRRLSSQSDVYDLYRRLSSEASLSLSASWGWRGHVGGAAGRPSHQVGFFIEFLPSPDISFISSTSLARLAATIVAGSFRAEFVRRRVESVALNERHGARFAYFKHYHRARRARRAARRRDPRWPEETAAPPTSSCSPAAAGRIGCPQRAPRRPFRLVPTDGAYRPPVDSRPEETAAPRPPRRRHPAAPRIPPVGSPPEETAGPPTQLSRRRRPAHSAADRPTSPSLSLFSLARASLSLFA
jgi:hypothetical protein